MMDVLGVHPLLHKDRPTPPWGPSGFISVGILQVQPLPDENEALGTQHV